MAMIPSGVDFVTGKKSYAIEGENLVDEKNNVIVNGATIVSFDGSHTMAFSPSVPVDSVTSNAPANITDGSVYTIICFFGNLPATDFIPMTIGSVAFEWRSTNQWYNQVGGTFSSAFSSNTHYLAMVGNGANIEYFECDNTGTVTSRGVRGNNSIGTSVSITLSSSTNAFNAAGIRLYDEALGLSDLTDELKSMEGTAVGKDPVFNAPMEDTDFVPFSSGQTIREIGTQTLSATANNFITNPFQTSPKPSDYFAV